VALLEVFRSRRIGVLFLLGFASGLPLYLAWPRFRGLHRGASMGTKAKQYTRAYVDRAVRLCEESNRPIAEVARDLGVEYATLYGWMTKAGKTKRREGPPDPPRATAGTPGAMQAEIERLQLELEETKKQLEFAKKAAAFFAQQNK
jgi:transposase